MKISANKWSTLLGCLLLMLMLAGYATVWAADWKIKAVTFEAKDGHLSIIFFVT